MTFHTYRSGLNVYTVCECGAYAIGPFHHLCDSSRYPKFMRDCACRACVQYRSWRNDTQP